MNKNKNLIINDTYLNKPTRIKLIMIIMLNDYFGFLINIIYNEYTINL